ncbi:beta-galactosidase [Streptomyces sp. NPDC047971]|uniref:beta-galactosidase n=1 Tax=Streptomyces sp. NPDC047971 TaxID=3154499 RepID=UPI003405090C
MRRPTRRHTVAGVLAALLMVLATVGLLGRQDPAGESGKDAYWFGTLQTAPEHAVTEYEHGVRVAHLDIDWGDFEPEKDIFDDAYAERIKERVRVFHDAGLRVELGLGLHQPPEWLARTYPWAVYVNQFGERSPRTANIVFSETVRFEAEQYATRVTERIGLENVWALRIGVGETGEYSYPAPVSTERAQAEYWAYDDNAQSTASDSDRPTTVPQNPFPEWRPGDETYRGQPFTERQVRLWYAWYLGALADAVNWQIGMYTELGHEGPLKVLVPGAGFPPWVYDAAVADRLDGKDPGRLVGRGVAFFETLGLIHGQGNVRIVTTALVDGTGRPRDNGCRPDDAAVDVRTADERTVGGWSSARWVVAVARANGFAHVSGESAGPQVAPYHPGVMDAAARQMTSCGLEGIMWAFDRDLYDGTPGSSLAEYAAVIRRLG